MIEGDRMDGDVYDYDSERGGCLHGKGNGNVIRGYEVI